MKTLDELRYKIAGVMCVIKAFLDIFKKRK